jgi:hypothetical protein
VCCTHTWHAHTLLDPQPFSPNGSSSRTLQTGASGPAGYNPTPRNAASARRGPRPRPGQSAHSTHSTHSTRKDNQPPQPNCSRARGAPEGPPRRQPPLQPPTRSKSNKSGRGGTQHGRQRGRAQRAPSRTSNVSAAALRRPPSREQRTRRNPPDPGRTQLGQKADSASRRQRRPL